MHPPVCSPLGDAETSTTIFKVVIIVTGSSPRHRFFRTSGSKLTCSLKKKKSLFLDFPGSLVVKTLHFQCRGAGSIPGQGTKIPHAARHGQISLISRHLTSVYLSLLILLPLTKPKCKEVLLYLRYALLSHWEFCFVYRSQHFIYYFY